MAKGGGHNKGQKMPYRVVRAFAGKSVRRSPHWTIGSAQADMRLSLLAANAGRVEFAENEFAENELVIVDVRTDEVVDKPLKCTVCDERWATETGPSRRDAPATCRDCEGDDEPGGSDEDVLARDLPYDPTRYRPGGEPVPVAAPVIVPPGDRFEVVIGGEVRSGKTPAAEVAERLREIVAEQQAEGMPPGFEAAVAPFLRKNPLPDADPSALLDALGRLNLPRAVWSDGTVATVANGMLWTLQAVPHATTGTPCGVWSVASPIAVRGYFLPERAARFIRDRRSP